MLLGTYRPELREAQLWLQHAYAEDPDAQCRELALAGLQAMALLAKLATPEVNKIKLAHEGLLSPMMASLATDSQPLQLAALAATPSPRISFAWA